MKFIFVLVALLPSLFGLDYDCVFIGSSPILIFEALYQQSSGKKVLILDESPVLGGVWRSIEACGIKHVDVGCHDIGSSLALKEFLEVYGGCQMVHTNETKNFYFSKGCYELIDHLEQLIEKMRIDVSLNTRAERAIVDENHQCISVELKDQRISTQKVYMGGGSCLQIGNETPKTIEKSKYYHLYLLIHDPTPPRFAYQGRGVSETARMMNLTRFVDLENTAEQLIVFQTRNEAGLNAGQKFLDELKQKDLVDPAAYILKSDFYIYEQWPAGTSRPPQDYQPYFEILQTHSFQRMTTFLNRWKQMLKPYASY